MLNNIQQQQLEQAVIKAATAGFVQSVTNRGATEQEAAMLGAWYADAQEGGLSKVAAKRQLLDNAIANDLARLGY